MRRRASFIERNHEAFKLSCLSRLSDRLLYDQNFEDFPFRSARRTVSLLYLLDKIDQRILIYRDYHDCKDRHNSIVNIEMW